MWDGDIKRRFEITWTNQSATDDVVMHIVSTIRIGKYRYVLKTYFETSYEIWDNVEDIGTAYRKDRTISKCTTSQNLNFTNVMIRFFDSFETNSVRFRIVERTRSMTWFSQLELERSCWHKEPSVGWSDFSRTWLINRFTYRSDRPDNLRSGIRVRDSSFMTILDMYIMSSTILNIIFKRRVRYWKRIVLLRAVRRRPRRVPWLLHRGMRMKNKKNHSQIHVMFHRHY